MSELLAANGPLAVYPDRIEVSIPGTPPFAPVSDAQQADYRRQVERFLNRLSQANPNVRIRNGCGVGMTRCWTVTITTGD